MTRKFTELEIKDKITEKCKSNGFTFIGFMDYNDNFLKRKCIVQCNKCNKESIYSGWSIYHSMVCKHCRKKFLLSEDEAIEKIENICQDNNLKFMGFYDNTYNGVNTRIRLVCNLCGKEINLKLKDISIKKQRIHTCKYNKVSYSRIKLEIRTKTIIDEIQAKLKNTDFEFIKFINNGFVGIEKTRVVLKCKICASEKEFSLSTIMSPNFSGICRKCHTQSKRSKIYTIKMIEDRCKELNLTFESIEDKNRINSQTTVITRCNVCGKLLSPVRLTYLFLHSKKCKYCNNNSSYTRKEAEELAMKTCIENDWSFMGYVDSEYQNSMSKVRIHCNKCKKDFIIEIGTLWRKPDKCHSCGVRRHMMYKQKKAELLKKYTKLIKDKIKDINMEFIRIMDDKRTITKKHVQLRCKECGIVSTYTVGYIISKNGIIRCKNCDKYLLTNDEAISQINEICKKHDFTFDGFNNNDNTYKGKLTRLKLHCNKCLYEWSNTSFEMLQRGILCPKCQNHVWKMEEEIKNVLRSANIKFIHDCRSRDLHWLRTKNSLSLDFYIPTYNIAIECQGGQHFKTVEHFGGEEGYKERLNRDILKQRLCKEHGIRLLYYDSQNGYKKFLNEEVYNTKDEILNKLMEIIRIQNDV